MERVPGLWRALLLALFLHFAADFLYHFEAFYPLSVLGKWDEDLTMAGLFCILLVLGAPVVVWLARRDPRVGWFAAYGVLLSLAPFDPDKTRRILWAAAISGLWLALFRTAEMRRWVLGGLVAYLPDLLRSFLRPLDWVHGRAHYNPALDLGDWVSLLFRGRWQVPVNDRIFDPYYLAGYGLEMLLEAAILFGGLYLLTRRARAADLTAVHHQDRAVHEGSLVG